MASTIITWSRAVSRSDSVAAGLKSLRQGKSLSEAARQLGVSRERLGSYVKRVAGAQWFDGKWAINDDRRRLVPFIENGLVRLLMVRGYEPARLAGEHWDDAHRVLTEPGDAETFARKWQGLFVRDTAGERHFFTTDLNEIYRAAYPR